LGEVTGSGSGATVGLIFLGALFGGETFRCPPSLRAFDFFRTLSAAAGSSAGVNEPETQYGKYAE